MALRIVTVLLVPLLLSACTSMPKPMACAIIGGGAGAIAGAAYGREYARDHNDGEAAGIGAATMIGSAALGWAVCKLFREEPAPPPRPAPAPPPPPPPPPAPEPEPVVDVCAGVIRLRGVEFEFDSATITPVSSVVLDTAVEGLMECPDVAVRVEGHTDSVGTDAYNQALGLRRAEAVKNYLVRGGVTESRVTTRSYGESRPVASNDTDDGRAMNRRVELHTEK